MLEKDISEEVIELVKLAMKSEISKYEFIKFLEEKKLKNKSNRN